MKDSENDSEEGSALNAKSQLFLLSKQWKLVNQNSCAELNEWVAVIFFPFYHFSLFVMLHNCLVFSSKCRNIKNWSWWDFSCFSDTWNFQVLCWERERERNKTTAIFSSRLSSVFSTIFTTRPSEFLAVDGKTKLILAKYENLKVKACYSRMNGGSERIG